MNVIKAAKQILDESTTVIEHSTDGLNPSHAYWMLTEIKRGGMSEGKANRWLGYAQSTLVHFGKYTLEEMKIINKANS